MLKAYKYRLYPNAKQAAMLGKHFGVARYIYNWALALNNRYYQIYGQGLSRRQLEIQVKKKRKLVKYHWLKEVNSQSIVCAIWHMHAGLKNFFEGRTQRPRFKSKKSNWQSFQCPQHVSIDQDNRVINLPKIKGIKSKIHRRFEGKIKTCTIKRNPKGHYSISVLVDDAQALPEKAQIKEQNTLGIDVGIQHFAITSQGVKKENPKYLSQSLKKLNQAQRQLSRKKKGSNNRAKQRKSVACIHDQVVQRRNFYHHQVANQLLNDNQVSTLAFEDLNIKGMIRNKKLSRNIADVAWSRFISIVKYKAKWQGKNVIFCNRFAPSSRQCECGYNNNDLTLKDRHWRCPECHAEWDRDILAANNIKKFATSDALGQSVCVKQFPCNNRFRGPVAAKGHSDTAVAGRKKLTLEQPNV
jgi:putative transposase